MPHNVIPSINRTISLLNINRLHLLDNWHQQYQTSKFGDSIDLIDHYAFGSYSLDNLPDALKVHIRQHCGVSSRAWNAVKHRSTTTNFSELQQTILKQDQLHNTSLKEFNPDLYNTIFL